MTDEDFRALQEQALQVSELVSHPGWDVLVDFVRFSPGLSIALRQNELLNGGVKSWEDYQKKTGWLEGSDFVIDANNRLQKMVIDESERREEKRLADEDPYES